MAEERKGVKGGGLSKGSRDNYLGMRVWESTPFLATKGLKNFIKSDPELAPHIVLRSGNKYSLMLRKPP